MSDAQRGQLVQIWILAADKNGVIEAPNGVELAAFICRVCCMESEPDLQLFESLRFITTRLATNRAAPRRQPDATVTPARRQPDATVTPQSREEKRREEKSRDRVEAEVQTASRRLGAKPTDVLPVGILTFPTVGTNGHQWLLTQAQCDEWTALYPGLDILGECRKALAWVQANPQLKKTPGGMNKFLVGWMNRCTDNTRPSPGSRFSKTAGNKAAIKSWLEGRLE